MLTKYVYAFIELFCGHHAITLFYLTDLSWTPCDACLFTMPVKVSYAQDHGVCPTDSQGLAQDILYRQKPQVLHNYQRQDETVPVVLKFFFLSFSLSLSIFICLSS